MTGRLLAEAYLTALAARLALRLLPWGAALRVVRAAWILPAAGASETACCEGAARASRAVAHHTCLYRAVTAYALLARRYPSVRLHLGATVVGGFGSHAWVSIAGRALDPDASRYELLWTAPPLEGR